jgi:dihydrofolate reductase
MIISIIVAAGKNNEIGQGGRLLCHLPADLRHFKEITSGHTIVMGRVTFNSLPKGALPNRRNIIVSRNKDLKPEGAEIFSSLDSVLVRFRDEDEIFIIGGAQIYNQSIDFADRIYLTRIHSSFPEADAFFPKIDLSRWRMTGIETFPADEQNPFAYSFIEYDRV